MLVVDETLRTFYNYFELCLEAVEAVGKRIQKLSFSCSGPFTKMFNLTTN